MLPKIWKRYLGDFSLLNLPLRFYVECFLLYEQTKVFYLFCYKIGGEKGKKPRYAWEFTTRKFVISNQCSLYASVSFTEWSEMAIVCNCMFTSIFSSIRPPLLLLLLSTRWTERTQRANWGRKCNFQVWCTCWKMPPIWTKTMITTAMLLWHDFFLSKNSKDCRKEI